MNGISSPAPPGLQLSTIFIPVGDTRGGGPLSNPSSGTSVSVSGQTRTSPPPPPGGGGNLSLASNRTGGPGATFNSWDAGGDASNLTFSQVHPSAARQLYLVEPERAFRPHDVEDVLSRNDMSPLLTKMSPRKRGAAAVRFATFEEDGGCSAIDSKPNVACDRRSFSWHPQGLFGAALERFQIRGAASNTSAVTASMGGTVLAADVPDDLPPEPSPGARHLSGPSVHAIQFDTEFGGSATPFMSISSPGLSRRSISFPRISVPQLSAGSVHVAANSFERDTAPLTGGDELHKSLPLSLVASPALNNDTVPRERAGYPLSSRESRACTPRAASPLLSPSTETARFRGPLFIRKGGHSVTSHRTETTAATSNTTTTNAADDDVGSTSEIRDFLMLGESVSPKALPAAMATAATAAASVTNMCVSHTDQPLLHVEEQRERANVEFAEGVAFNKLRSLQVSQSLAQARVTREEARRTSRYAGDTLARQLDEEEREQLNSEMLGRMQKAEAEHQQSMRALRDQDLRRSPLSPSPPAPLPSSDDGRVLSRLASSRRQILDAAMAVPQCFSASHSHQGPAMNPMSSQLPPLSSQQLSAEIRTPATTAASNQSNNTDAELLLEIARQRDIKYRTSNSRSQLRLEGGFHKVL